MEEAGGKWGRERQLYQPLTGQVRLAPSPVICARIRTARAFQKAINVAGLSGASAGNVSASTTTARSARGGHTCTRQRAFHCCPSPAGLSWHNATFSASENTRTSTEVSRLANQLSTAHSVSSSKGTSAGPTGSESVETARIPACKRIPAACSQAKPYPTDPEAERYSSM